MEIVFIFFLILLFGIVLFLSYKIVKWIIARKVRVVGVVSILFITIVNATIYQLFFVKMKFIQSNVYPNLYLVKNEIKNRDSLSFIIKKRVVEKINLNFIANGKKYTENTHKAPYAALAFYTYTKSSKLSIFQDYGTAYFIDYEEDLSGFSVEEFGMYRSYKLATFNIHSYKKDSTQYYGLLEYYEKGDVVKIDTLILQKK